MSKVKCSVDGCGKFVHARNLCPMHLRRLRKFGALELPPKEPRRCSVAACTCPHHAHGFCHAHNERIQRNGIPNRVRGNLPLSVLAARMAERVDKVSAPPHWLWTKSLNKGYGWISFNGVRLQAHRVAYELAVGPIPDGFEIDHLCRVPACVNPEHLEAVPHKVNAARGIGPTAINGRKMMCKRKHLFTPENTYINPRGERNCRACRRMLRAGRY